MPIQKSVEFMALVGELNTCTYLIGSVKFQLNRMEKQQEVLCAEIKTQQQAYTNEKRALAAAASRVYTSKNPEIGSNKRTVYYIKIFDDIRLASGSLQAAMGTFGTIAKKLLKERETKQLMCKVQNMTPLPLRSTKYHASW